MNHNKIALLINAMNANKIKYNKQFSSVIEHGFTDEARESLFEEIIDDMENMVRHGINGDFNKSMKETLRQLSDIAVNLGEENRRSLTLERLRVEKRACMSAVKMTKENTLDFDLLGNTKEYLESTKDGMKVLQEAPENQTGVESLNMKTCRKLIEDIVSSLDSITDVSSIEAAKYYNDVITKIRSFRIKIARSGGLYDTDSVDLLKNVQSIIREWSKLCTTHIRYAKIQDIYGIPSDDLSKAIESVSIRQNVEMFLNRCEAYAKETATMRNNGTMEKIMASRARIREIEKQEQDVVARFKSGALEREDAEYELQHLKDQKDYIQYDIDRMNVDMVSREDISLRREMISKIERPIRASYNHVKNNRLHVHALFSGMDFARLVGMVDNNLSQHEFAMGIEEMQNALVTRGVIDSQGRLLMDNIKQKLDLVDQVTAQQLPNLDIGNEQKESSLLDMMLEKDAAKENESVRSKEEQNKNIF